MSDKPTAHRPLIPDKIETPVTRTPIRLRNDQWEALERIARELNIRAVNGPSVGKISWRALIAMIADGDLIVSRKS